MKKIFTFLLITAILCSQFYGQASRLTPRQRLYDEPIKIGVQEFQERLDTIKQEREPLGLILCGGSARAFAHIGVLKAMEENGVYPDFIVANSMGAIIGLLYAYGFSPDQILEAITSVNLTSFFEPVIPLHGGLISTRKFTALIEKLTQSPDTDLRECPIPIIILTEDMVSQRQIWNAAGPLSQIMTQAFSMPVFMEPPAMEGPEGELFRLSDSGTIDIAGIKVARSFSSNLMVSTAFYNPKVNLNNPIVVLNRNFSIGKERIAISDIKTYNPLLIQNNVESISFMRFDDAPYISSIGYESAMEVMEDIVALPHPDLNLQERRIYTEKLKDDFIFRMQKNDSVYIQKNYLGAKVWPFFPAADYSDYYLNQNVTLSAFAFDHIGNFYARAGGSLILGTKNLSADILLNYKPSYAFETEFLGSITFTPGDQNLITETYAAAMAKINPKFLPSWFTGLTITGEWKGNGTFKTQDLFLNAALGASNAALSHSIFDFSFEPGIFASGNSFSHLNLGTGFSSSMSLNLGSFASISNNASGRIALWNTDSSVLPQVNFYAKDNYRSVLPDSPQNSWCLTDSAELALTVKSLNMTFAEFLIIPSFKAGVFYDIAWANNFSSCAGAFARTKASLIGLTTYVLEAGGGWDFSRNEPFAFFKMKSNF